MRTNLKTAIIAIICMLFAGCANVDELDSWDGKSRSWVTDKLGPPDARVELSADVPDVGSGEGVADKVQTMSPGYTGKVEYLQWRTKRSNYDVYLILVKDGWVIVDALKWKDVVF